MPVESQHTEYIRARPLWEKCRTVIEGEDAVKAKGMNFLPKLDGQSASEYEAYKQRALFYASGSRTLQGLVGAIFRKMPEIDAPAEMLEDLENVTAQGTGLESFLRLTVSEVLTTGRFGILVDMNEGSGNKPYLTGYPAESIINWRAGGVGGVDKLELVVLEENYNEKTSDPFISRKRTQYRVLSLDENGLYRVELFRRQAEGGDWTPVASYEPKMLGNRLDFIPFVFANPLDSTSSVAKPPLQDLVAVNLSHYRTSADLEHGRHFTALPTAWVAGFDADTELKIGSQTAWVAEDSDAKAGYLEFTGQGLSALENAMKEKQDLMAVLGARLLEEPKRGVEAAQTHRIRRSGENSVLAALARSVSKTATIALRWWATWAGESHKPVVALNTDFMDERLEAKDIVALMNAWNEGAMSWDSLIYNFRKGEILPESRTKEEESRLIQQERLQKETEEVKNLESMDS